jgi:hypothetical protein
MTARRWAALAVVVLLVGTVNSAVGAPSKPIDRGNCTTLHKACTRCQSLSSFVAGSLVTRKVCRACNTQQGWALDGQGSNMTCGEYLIDVRH